MVICPATDCSDYFLPGMILTFEELNLFREEFSFGIGNVT